jgi:hypothetical protein
MTARDDRAEDRQALSRLLDTCGADRTRWPARERLRFAGFISEDAEAQRMLSEARALDALLDCAPRASEEREHALKERIVASALRSGATSFSVVAGSAQAAPAPQVAPERGPVLRRFAAAREWPAAAVLAASLVVGVMLGSAGTFDTTAQEMAEAAGFATAGAPSQLALGEEMLASADEELL